MAHHWYIIGISMVYQWYVNGMSMVCQWYVDGMSTVCRWYIDDMYHKTSDGYWLFGWPILQNPLQDTMSTPCIKEKLQNDASNRCVSP